jgi:hypothetical protein
MLSTADKNQQTYPVLSL